MVKVCNQCNRNYFISDENVSNPQINTGICTNCKNLEKNRNISNSQTIPTKTKIKPIEKNKIKTRVKTQAKTKNKAQVQTQAYNPPIKFSTILMLLTIFVILFYMYVSPIIYETQQNRGVNPISLVNGNKVYIDDDSNFDEKDPSIVYNSNLPIADVVVIDGVVVGYNTKSLDITTPQQVFIPDDVTKIDTNAFKDFYGLSGITLGENVTTIDRNAFKNCYNLEYVALNDNLKTINDYAFYNIEIKTINLPETLEYLGVSSLNNVNIANVDIPTTTKLGSDCLSFTSYYPNGEGNEVIVNNLYVKAPSNDVIDINYEIPEGITSIEDYAFYSSDVEYVSIPDGVIYIAPRAFMLSKNLKEVSFPTSLKAIDTYAFYNCKSLTKVNFNKDLSTIGYRAFDGCDLLNLEIPSTTKLITIP